MARKLEAPPTIDASTLFHSLSSSPSCAWRGFVSRSQSAESTSSWGIFSHITQSFSIILVHSNDHTVSPNESWSLRALADRLRSEHSHISRGTCHRVAVRQYGATCTLCDAERPPVESTQSGGRPWPSVNQQSDLARRSLCSLMLCKTPSAVASLCHFVRVNRWRRNVCTKNGPQRLRPRTVSKQQCNL
jgi:hypothetical protein